MNGTTDESKCIRITSHGSGKITIEGLNREDEEKLEGAIRGGMWYFRVKDGKSEFLPHYKPLPNIADDKDMLPYWRASTEQERSCCQREFLFDSLSDHSSPAILIQSLCGYNYTPEGYKTTARLLESYGFECMRSKRGDDATFWEIWMLPGFWAAKGDLAECLKEIESKTTKKKLEEVFNFLRRHYVSFGTLDTTVQRLAMVIDD